MDDQLVELARILGWPVSVAFIVWSIGRHYVAYISARYSEDDDEGSRGDGG